MWVGLAVVVTTILGLIPFADLLTYPIRLFSTFIHETGHILAALVSFGDVSQMVVNMDSSGVTYTSGGSRFLIGSGGYLGTTVFGALLLLSARRARHAQWAMGLTGAMMVFITAAFAGSGSIWPVLLGGGIGVGLTSGALFLRDIPIWARGLFVALSICALSSTATYLWANDGLLTWLLGLGSGALLLGIARYGKGEWVKASAAFLGVQVGLDSLSDVFTLVSLSAFTPVHTDAQNMARDFGLPAIVWAVLWTAIASAMLLAVVGFLIFEWRKESKAAA